MCVAYLLVRSSSFPSASAYLRYWLIADCTLLNLMKYLFKINLAKILFNKLYESKYV